MSRLWDFVRSYGKTSVRLVNRCHGNGYEYPLWIGIKTENEKGMLKFYFLCFFRKCAIITDFQINNTLVLYFFILPRSIFLLFSWLANTFYFPVFECSPPGLHIVNGLLQLHYIAHMAVPLLTAYTVSFYGTLLSAQWRRALMFSLIYAWANSWANNRDAGDLKRHHADYDVTVISDPSEIHLEFKSCEISFAWSSVSIALHRAWQCHNFKTTWAPIQYKDVVLPV